jgi:hypothetical protein
MDQQKLTGDPIVPITCQNWIHCRKKAREKSQNILCFSLGLLAREFLP